MLDLLKSMGPSSIDAEIRSLGPSAGGDIKLLELFMLFIERQIGLRRDFEFTEALLGLFLKVSDFRGTLLQFCCQSLPLSLQTPFSYVHEGHITFSITPYHTMWRHGGLRVSVLISGSSPGLGDIVLCP